MYTTNTIQTTQHSKPTCQSWRVRVPLFPKERRRFCSPSSSASCSGRTSSTPPLSSPWVLPRSVPDHNHLSFPFAFFISVGFFLAILRCPLSSGYPPFPTPTQPRGNFRLQATPKPVSGTKLITEVGASPLYRADGKEVQFKDLYLPPKGSEGKEGANILIFLRHFG